jgi:DNA topoisomerase IB
MDKLAHAVLARFEAMEQVGEVAVDSGTLLVIDPAYLDSWGTGEHPELSMDGYRAAWEEGRNQLNFANGGTAAVFLKGFGGDGTYPVFIEGTTGENGVTTTIGSFAVDLSGPPTQGGTDEPTTLVEKVAVKYKQKIETDKGNTVYTYSDKQIAARNRKKAERIEALRKSIGDLRRKMKRDIKSDDPEKSLTALAVALIDHTFERVGNEGSAKDGHYGVTGWKKKHITFTSKGATIRYVGKAGVKHEKKVTDGALKQALREAYEACDGDNKCLFSGEWGSVTAEKVNEYLEPFDITAKDIRGFHANREMQTRLKAIRSKGDKLPSDKKAKEKLLKSEFLKALDETAEAVGHEASTLRSQYLIPGLEEQYCKDGKVSDKMSSALEVEGSLEDRLAARFVLGLL